MTVEEIRGNLGDSTDNFPVGMHVLAVDDDPTYLRKLDCLLRRCQYQVTTTSQSRTALKMLRENQNRFDLIITNVHMPDMDGFKLLELVSLEMDLPVIMLSTNNDPKLVMKGITHGACDYLVKPVRLEVLSNIWQHVIRRKKFDPKSQNNSTAQEGSEGGEGPIKDDEEDRDDNGNGNEDSGTQKMPRFVWSIELHRKFVAAVDQLGIEKALPKRILDMMNVEGLTRENVASHLQNYRLYFNKMRKDASYLRMGSLDGLGDVRTFAASARLPNTTLSPYPPSGMLGRLDSPAGMNLRNFSSSALVQTSHPQNSNNSLNALAKFQPVVSPANQSASLFQGLGPLNQLQQSQSMSRIGEFSSIDYPRLFTAGTTFTDTRVKVGSSSNSLASAPSNPLMLQGNQQQTQSGRGFTNQSSLNSESRCNENWNNTIHFSKFPLNTLPLSEPVNHDQFPQFNNNSTRHIQNNPVHDSECREGLVGDIVQNMNQTQNQMCGLQQQDYSQYSNNSFGNLSRNVDQNNAFYNRRMGVSLVGQSNTGALTPLQHSKIEIKSNDGFLSEQTKPLGGLVPCCYDSLDDLMHPLMKREKDGTMLTDGEFGFDAYSFGSCICLQILVGLGLLLLLGLLVSCLLEEL